MDYAHNWQIKTSDAISMENIIKRIALSMNTFSERVTDSVKRES